MIELSESQLHAYDQFIGTLVNSYVPCNRHGLDGRNEYVHLSSIALESGHIVSLFRVYCRSCWWPWRTVSNQGAVFVVDVDGEWFDIDLGSVLLSNLEVLKSEALGAVLDHCPSLAQDPLLLGRSARPVP